MKRAKIKSLEAINRQILKSRINIILIIVFLLCLTLIFRLGYLQIVEGDTYQEEVENAQYVEINQSVPRGEIYDRNGNLLVGNESQRAIYFTRHRNMKSNEIMDLAVELSGYINMDTETITLRDKQDYIISQYPDELESIMSEQVTLLEDGNITQDEFTQEVYNQLDEEQADEILTEGDLNTLAIYVRMVNARELNPVIVKSGDVTEEEFAKVNESLDELDGITTGMDWQRHYPYDDTLKTIFGEVSSSEEGLPKELLNYYMARGYSRNDRVGKTYLEFQYENVLRGEKEQVKYSTDKSGEIINQEVIKPGKAGDDLYLTIDIELQQELEELAEHHLTSLRELAEDAADRNAQNGDVDYTIIPDHMDTVVLVVQDPNNGEVLAMVGKKLNDEGEIVNFNYGALTSTYVVGSSIKGATVTTGYQNDVLEAGEFMVDEPLTFADGTSKSSFFNRDSGVRIDDQEALMVSSNVYMFKIALRMAGLNYYDGMPLPNDIEEAGHKLRNGLNQFGLGVSTGIDLPNEATGLSPELKHNPGNYIDLAIGQYDTYSALQLSQYVSTIANDGQRVQLHLGKEVRGSDSNASGPVLQSFNGKVLNNVAYTEEQLGQIQSGFYDAFNTHDEATDRYGTGWDAYHNLEPKAAGKTGTAEAFNEGDPVLNQTYVGYAPYDDPEMAFSVIFPNMPNTIPFFPAQYLGRDVINKYYEVVHGEEEEGPYQYELSEFYPKLVYGSYD
ncbi:penicillin-binding protein [Salinicoccus sediminis]|uniref:Penicillin-binding protein n=1 Tax=Salinicoccus sediminis TaxID=1432562 RepID=A0A0M2SMP3_9STAP|nr:penicillin-binding protein 2 [Salinicoccus sediminis]KKK35508.1 penicillin-binding protein [Salinicoccus sediminis]